MNTNQLPITELDSLVDDYKESIDKGEKEDLLNALIIRNKIQHKINYESISTDNLTTISGLDKRLRERARSINLYYQIADWQKILKPPKEHWWFSEIFKPYRWWDKFDWFWSFISILFLTACLSFIIAIAQIIFTSTLGGLGKLIGAFTITITSILTLLAGSGTVTVAGNKTRKVIFNSLNIPEGWQEEFGALISLVLLILFFLIYLWLPIKYLHIADSAYEKHNLLVAEKNYTTMIDIKPSSYNAYYKLGKIYEQWQEFESAREHYVKALKNLPIQKNSEELIEEYSLAIARTYQRENNLSKSTVWFEKALKSKREAYKKNIQENYLTLSKEAHEILNFLVRNYNQMKNFSPAVRQLQFAYSETPPVPPKDSEAYKKWNQKDYESNDYQKYLIKSQKKLEEYKNWKDNHYNVLKHFGWIRYNQERFLEAEKFLKEAIDLDSYAAPAYCLLAKAKQQQEGMQQQEKENWEKCISNATPMDLDEDNWVGEANKRLEEINRVSRVSKGN